VEVENVAADWGYSRAGTIREASGALKEKAVAIRRKDSERTQLEMIGIVEGKSSRLTRRQVARECVMMVGSKADLLTLGGERVALAEGESD
jgi:hypothetical protein